MDGFDKGMTICLGIFMLVVFGIFALDYHRDVVAMQYGYNQVQKAGTTSTMWVKGER